jgi:hypothetical protein
MEAYSQTTEKNVSTGTKKICRNEKQLTQKKYAGNGKRRPWVGLYTWKCRTAMVDFGDCRCLQSNNGENDFK